MKKVKKTLKKEKERRIGTIKKELRETKSKFADTEKRLEKAEKDKSFLIKRYQELQEEKDNLHKRLLDVGLLTPSMPKILDEKGDSSIALMPWKERKKLLHGLKFTDQIKEVPSVLAHSPGEVVKAIRVVSKLPRSGGAVIKNQSSTYPVGKENPAGVEYKNLQSVTVKVLDVNDYDGERNYTVGIPISGGLLVLGDTFNTNDEYTDGDKIGVLIDEVWRHRWPDGSIGYSVHNPRVNGISGDAFTTKKELDSIVDSTGREVDEGAKMMAAGDTTTSTPGVSDVQGKRIGRPKLPGKPISHEEWRKYVILDKACKKSNKSPGN